MLDLFTIFTKGGIVLWYFQGTALSLTPAVNALIKSVILQERGGSNSYNHDALTLKFKMDNQYELIFVAVYQKVLQLAYVDKLLDQVLLAFRDRYKNELDVGALRSLNFGQEFEGILQQLEEESRVQSLTHRPMRSFVESKKAEKFGKACPEAKGGADVEIVVNGQEVGGDECPQAMPLNGSPRNKVLPRGGAITQGGVRKKVRPGGKKTVVPSKSSPKMVPKRVKADRKWDGVVSKEEAVTLDCSNPAPQEPSGVKSNGDFKPDYSMVGQMKGQLQSLEVEEEPEASVPAPSKGGGVFSFFKSLTGGKTITQESMAPVLERMKEHLIGKNVAADIADKLCGSVSAKLDGKVIGTFSGVQSTVRTSMEQALVQILSPKRRIDILRDALEARDQGRPYTITFCGVNGVGKSTNLAKVAFWLMENGLRVLIAACDTFRSGAVEQLRTHTRHLAALHPPEEGEGPPRVFLYDRGYGKDAAGVALEAINYAGQQRYDVVLVDTAGRMQDNEPLMRALAKLIHVNTPDLVLFVGEALVGNEAVDQLSKFNRALLDNAHDHSPKVIDGILLTKFDTIDDKVGAAISMTYTTGQPIVFVGTGQTYTDLRSLNGPAVVSALLK